MIGEIKEMGGVIKRIPEQSHKSMKYNKFCWKMSE